MTIALDIDDTITRHPAFFALVSQALIQAGHRVLIITFRDEGSRTATETDLKRWGIAYTDLICWSMENNDLGEIDQWKGNLCREHGVDIFFEDDPSVLQYIDNDTVCFQPYNQSRRSPEGQDSQTPTA